MKDRSRGFTLVELAVALVVVGILAAVAIANYIGLQSRAREAALKDNMHVLQVAAEDYGVRSSGVYPTVASQAMALTTQGGSVFRNPFTHETGDGRAWVDQPAWTLPLASGSTVAGLVAYGDSAAVKYQVAGRGATADLPLVLSSGQ